MMGMGHVLKRLLLSDMQDFLKYVTQLPVEQIFEAVKLNINQHSLRPAAHAILELAKRAKNDEAVAADQARRDVELVSSRDDGVASSTNSTGPALSIPHPRPRTCAEFSKQTEEAFKW